MNLRLNLNKRKLLYKGIRNPKAAEGMIVGGFDMKIGVIGIHHQNTPIHIREKAAFTTNSLKKSAQSLLKEEGIDEVVILSTCNRSEVYICGENIEEGIKAVKKLYLEKKSPELNAFLFIKTNENAISHLYRVASGLDSRILGEDQILGQVKDALTTAQSIGAGKKFLNKLFREAITFAKKMKNECSISENPLSISSVGVHYLQNAVQDLQDKNIMVVGSGKMGILAIKYLQCNGVNNIWITNRTHGHAIQVAQQFEGVTTLDFEQRYDVLTEMDVLITATSSPHVIIKKEKMPNLTKPLTILDLALPRDVEDGIEDHEYIRLCTIDDLNQVVDENLAYRKQMACRIESQIHTEVETLLQWISSAKMDHVIQEFQQLSNEAAKAAMQNICKKVDLNENEQSYIDKIIRSSIQRLIKNPIEQLKQLESEQDMEQYKKVISRLFQFEEGA